MHKNRLMTNRTLLLRPKFSNFNGHCSKISRHLLVSRHSLVGRNFIWTGISLAVDRDLYLPMNVSSLYAIFIHILALWGHEGSISRGPTS